MPVQGVMMSTGSTTGTGDVPVMIPIAANTTLENMTNERLMALAKSNEQHKVVSEMLLKTAQSDLANSRKKVEELTAQLDEVRRELTAEKAINESRKIVEYQIAAVSGSLNQTDLSANQKEMARGSEEYGAEKQEERLKASINLNRDWERDVDEGSGNKTVYVKKDSNLEKDKSTSGRPTDSAATILVKSVLLSPRSPAVASNAEPVKIPAVSQRTWADADDEEEDESKAPVSAQGPGQGQRAQGGVYSRGPGQGHGEGPSRGGGSTDGSTYKSGRDKESTGQYGAGRGSKAGQPYNSYDGDRNRGFDRDNRESSYGGDHHSSFGGRGSGEGRGQFGGRGMNNMGGRGQADRGSIGSGAGNVVRPLRPTKIIPPTGGPFPSSPSKPPVEQERERERDGQDSAHGGGSPGIPRSINGTGATNNNDSSSSSSGKKLNSNPTSDVRNTKSLIFGGPPNPNPTFTRSTTSTFGSRDVRVLDAANAANASANANANTNANANATSSYSNTNSNFESPTRRKGPPAQFISTSPDRENSNTNSNSRFGDSSDEHADTEGNGEERAGSTDEGNMKNNAAMKSKKGIKNLRPAGRDGGRGDGWRGSGIGGRGRGRDDERRSLGGHEGSGGRGEAMKIPPPPYLAAYHRDKDNDSSATTGQSSGAGTSATETDRERGDSMRSSSATAGVNMDGSVCRFYSKGFCRFGADCNNLHTGPVVKSLNRPRADSAPEGDTEPDDASGRRMESDRREKGAQPGRGWGGREGGGRDAGRESKGRGRGGRRPHTASFDGSSSDVTPQTATNINITDAPVQSSTRSDIAANVDAMSIVSTSTVENASVGKGKSISTVVVAAAVAVAAKETVVISE